MLALEEIRKGREVGALEKDMEESLLPWCCTVIAQQDQSTDYTVQSTGGQDQSTGAQTSRLVARISRLGAQTSRLVAGSVDWGSDQSTGNSPGVLYMLQYTCYWAGGDGVLRLARV